MDLISKKDLINRLIPKYRDGVSDEYDRGANDMLKEVIEAVEEFSSQNKWIPCSERLPRPNTDVLTYRKDRAMPMFVDRYERYYGEDDGEYYEGWAYGEDSVTAWQPLPEPYKESEEE